MDVKKMGRFLKTLRKEKGLTQEQLAEILYVSGRTVSRWETGTNMPELSILIQMAEFYDVELKEILDGERKGEIMNQELKETLSKIADYNKLEKEKAMKAGNIAFGLTFFICAAAIIIQLIVMETLPIVLGETITLLAGGIAYIGMMLHNGVWETGSRFKSTPFKDLLISVVCSCAFTAALVLCYIRLGATADQTVRIAILFFAGSAILGFSVLRILAFCNQKKERKNKVNSRRR
ncbi:MAG: helix-turn-helix domain-containing protein [Lachnospiraceae bacterium]|nr:helix-turn-helix domain-containing protein [Lachnospiraceae bacterium]